MLQSVAFTSQRKALEKLVLKKNSLMYKRIWPVVRRMALREFNVLSFEKGANPELNGGVEKLKWLKPLGTYKPPAPNFHPPKVLKNSNLLAPGIKTADMVYLSNMFRDFFGDPVIDTSHYMLATFHKVLQRQIFFNGNLLIGKVFGYNIYSKTTVIQRELMVLLVIADTLALRKRTGDRREGKNDLPVEP